MIRNQYNLHNISLSKHPLKNVIITLMLCLVTSLTYADKTVLTIKGDGIRAPIHLSMEKLQTLPAIEVSTETIWTDESHKYKGILISTLISKSGATGKTLSMTALNDYTIEVPVDTLIRNNAFIAYQQDGKAMRVRDKGPLWLLYPFSDSPHINTPFYQSHSIWQLRSILVK